MMHKRSPALLFFFLLAASTAAWGQTPGASVNRSNSINVSVTSRTGEEIKALIRVELFRGDIPSLETYANLRGKASFYNLEDGSYTIRVSCPDFRAESQDVQLNSGFARRLTFLLMAEWNTEPVAIPEDPIVSVRWLAAPKEARREVVKSREELQKGNAKKAREHLNKALEISPGFSIALNEMGLCYRRENKNKEARKEFEKAIASDPEYLIPYLNLAEVLTEDKKYNEAGQLLARASQMHPRRGEPFFSMAKIQLDTGHLDRAERAARMALARDASRIPEVHLLLVNIYTRRGEKEKIAPELEAYLQMVPNGPHAEQARVTLAKIKQ